jgi:hypothetical protein
MLVIDAHHCDAHTSCPMPNAQALEIGRMDLLELFPRRDILWIRPLVVDGLGRPISGSYCFRFV